tara:strand:- start:841 stop:1047 length:207 start_codon:yes stop_codon:yes gene_type:complete
MKIFDDDKKSKYSKIISNKDLEKHSHKTTNVNILLNRVRLDKKKSYRKRIIFLILLFLIIGVISFLIY